MSRRTSVLGVARVIEREHCCDDPVVASAEPPDLRVIPRGITGLTLMLVAAVIIAGTAVLASRVAAGEKPRVNAGVTGAVTDPAVEKKTNAPDQATISGACVDENGKPIADARVRLFFVDFNHAVDFHAPPSQRQLQDVRTDNYGKFSLARADAKLKHAMLLVVAQLPGKATAFQIFGQGNKAMDAPLELKLLSAGTLRGRVTDIHRKPVAGAVVSTWGVGVLIDPVPGICCAVTDADGRYEINDIAQWKWNRAQVQPGAERMLWPAGWVRHRDYARQPLLRRLVSDTADITLQRRADVAGKVVWAKTGKPAAKTMLEFSSSEPPIVGDWWTRTTTDAQGRYRLEILPPGRYNVSVLHPRGPRSATPAKLKVGKNTHNLRIKERSEAQPVPAAQGGAGGGIF